MLGSQLNHASKQRQVIIQPNPRHQSLSNKIIVIFVRSIKRKHNTILIQFYIKIPNVIIIQKQKRKLNFSSSQHEKNITFVKWKPCIALRAFTLAKDESFSIFYCFIYLRVQRKHSGSTINSISFKRDVLLIFFF